MGFVDLYFWFTLASINNNNNNNSNNDNDDDVQKRPKRSHYSRSCGVQISQVTLLIISLNINFVLCSGEFDGDFVLSINGIFTSGSIK